MGDDGGSLVDEASFLSSSWAGLRIADLYGCDTLRLACTAVISYGCAVARADVPLACACR